MFRLTGICALILLFGLSACSEDKQQQQPPAEQQQQAPAVDAAAKAQQKANEAVEKAKASGEEAKRAVEKAVDDAVKQGSAAVEDAKKELTQASTAGQDKTSGTTPQVVEKANLLVASSSQKANELASKVQGQEKNLSDLADSTTASAAQKVAEVIPPETIALENNFGTVTLTHAIHGKAYGCTPCHGDATPGPFELTKELAHSTMCKDCHKSSGGPTGCTECHIK